MNTFIECAGFIENSCDDGPGIRSVLFLQGCSKNCAECHNAKLREHGKGKIFEIENLLHIINKKCCNKKITISGGEPLEQQESLLILLKRLREQEYNICVYTGWELDKIPAEIIGYLDYLKTGGFVKDLRNITMQYVGSTNQHMFEVKNGSLVEMSLIA